MFVCIDQPAKFYAQDNILVHKSLIQWHWLMISTDKLIIDFETNINYSNLIYIRNDLIVFLRLNTILCSNKLSCQYSAMIFCANIVNSDAICFSFICLNKSITSVIEFANLLWRITYETKVQGAFCLEYGVGVVQEFTSIYPENVIEIELWTFI